MSLPKPETQTAHLGFTSTIAILQRPETVKRSERCVRLRRGHFNLNVSKPTYYARMYQKRGQ